LIILPFILALCTPSDYWMENYDKGKNCESEKVIKEMKTNQNKFETYCADNWVVDPNEAIVQCKQDLAIRLLQACRETRVLKGGKLMYCRAEDKTTCCFTDYKCESKERSASKMLKTARKFLKDKRSLLKNFQKWYGYKTCYPIRGYDASRCAKDCENLKDTPLAEECRNRNGMLKCCIRRDKVNCDECRFCCTLPFCTYVTSNRVFLQLGEQDLNREGFKDEKSTLRGIDFIFSRNVFFRGTDNRCLKPESKKDPEKWKHYWPDDFAYAVTEKQLKEARTTKFDKNFFNYEDPKVFKMMTGKKYHKHFTETYGFDFVSKVGRRYKDNVRSDVECARRCILAEKSNFAKKCRKDGGIFKCCINTIDLSPFEWIRNQLKKSKHIGSSSNICGSKGTSGNCIFCTATFFCTLNDDGTVLQKFKRKKFNELGGVNLFLSGRFIRVPYKASFCQNQDFCQLEAGSLNITMFLNATSQEEICKVKTSYEGEGKVQDDMKESFDECKNRTSNIRICPDELLQDGPSSLARINADLRKPVNRRKKNAGKRDKKDKKKRTKKKRTRH